MLRVSESKCTCECLIAWGNWIAWQWRGERVLSGESSSSSPSSQSKSNALREVHEGRSRVWLWYPESFRPTTCMSGWMDDRVKRQWRTGQVRVRDRIQGIQLILSLSFSVEKNKNNFVCRQSTLTHLWHWERKLGGIKLRLIQKLWKYIQQKETQNYRNHKW